MASEGKVKVRGTILHAPTGAGKTQTFLKEIKALIGQGEQAVLAVPSLNLAEEVAARAKGEGIDTVVWRGRSHFVCPCVIRRAVEKGKLTSDEGRSLIENGFVDSELAREYRQDGLCCRRPSCTGDPFREFIEETIDTDLIVTTHSFLLVAPFSGHFPPGRHLFIDEIDSFVDRLKQPVRGVTAVSIPILRAAVDEVQLALNGRSTRKVLSQAVKEVEKGIESLERVLADRGLEVVLAAYGDQPTVLVPSAEEGIWKIYKGLEDVLAEMRGVDSLRLLADTIRKARSLIARTVSPRFPGEYSTARLRDGRLEELGVRGVLFSTTTTMSMRALLNALEPVHFWGASATLPRSCLSILRSSGVDLKVARDKRFFFKGSVMDLLVGPREWSMEAGDWGDYILTLLDVARSHRAVVLAYTHQEAEEIELSARAEGYTVFHLPAPGTSNEALEEVVGAFLSHPGRSVLISTLGGWRGLNILGKDVVFVITRVPYSHPASAEGVAIRTMGKSSFPAAKEGALFTLIQGLGRALREEGVYRRVVMADRRLVSHSFIRRVLQEIPAEKVFVVDLASISPSLGAEVPEPEREEAIRG